MNNILDVPGWLKSTNYTGPVGLTVKCYIKPDKVWEYKDLISERMQVILTKPGLLRFRLNSDYESLSLTIFYGWLKSGKVRQLC